MGISKLIETAPEENDEEFVKEYVKFVNNAPPIFLDQFTINLKANVLDDVRKNPDKYLFRLEDKYFKFNVVEITEEQFEYHYKTLKNPISIFEKKTNE